jgi:hypothetical protein
MVVGVENRADLVTKSQALAKQFGFDGMRFICSDVAAVQPQEVPPRIDVLTALHACDTATDDAIAFGLKHRVPNMVLVPCCQAEIAHQLRESQKGKASLATTNPLVELYRRPLHTREFGSQLTNVLRCLWLEANGYEVTVTELVGWEHSIKNELIVAKRANRNTKELLSTNAYTRLHELLASFNLPTIIDRYKRIGF